MRCPYCGAEVVGRKCIFCSSDLIEHIKKNGLEVDDFKEEVPVKKEEKQDDLVKKDEKKKKKKRNTDKRGNYDAIDEIRDLCADFLADTKDGFASYNSRQEKIAGETINKRLFQVLSIPDGDEVFLMHDDTLMSNGKNGFAITESGFYCKELFENLSIIRFKDLDVDDEVKQGNSTVYINDTKRTVVYLSGSGNNLAKLRDLVDDILDAWFDED